MQRTDKANTKQTPTITLPALWYHAPEYYQKEQDNIFKTEWLLFGHECILEKSGNYIAQTIAGYPIFVIKGNDGELKAFHNVCRHRASPLLSCGTGKTSVLRCPYHGWIYDTDGNLKKAPDFGGDHEALCDRTSLFPIHIKIWNGLIFICMTETAPDFIESLGDLPKAAKDTDLKNFTFHRGATHKLDCNWKTYVENYMEGYHIPTIHPELNKEVDMATYHVYPENRIARHVSEAREERKEDALNDGLWVWLWPYAALNVYKGGMNLELMVPTGPETMELQYYYLFRDIDDEDSIERVEAMSLEVTQEDIEICERVQKNLKAGIYETGELSPRHEKGLAYFQSLVREAVEAD